MTEEQRRPITILTYNVGNGLAKPDKLAAFLRESGADVIGLQENDAEQAEALEQIAAEGYPHRVIHGEGFDGCALLSKYPITDLDWHDLAIGRRALRATLDVDGRPLRMTVAHPQPPRLRRWGIAFDKTTRQQMDMLRLQSMTNKRNEAFDVMTNFIKKMQDSRSSIIGNMR